jgi:hypothetical protein
LRSWATPRRSYLRELAARGRPRDQSAPRRQTGVRPPRRLARSPARHLPDRLPDRGEHAYRPRPRHRPARRNLPPALLTAARQHSSRMTTGAEAAIWKDVGVWVLDDFRAWIEAIIEARIGRQLAPPAPAWTTSRRNRPSSGTGSRPTRSSAWTTWSSRHMRRTTPKRRSERSATLPHMRWHGVLTGQPRLSPVPAAQLAIVRSRHSA